MAVGEAFKPGPIIFIGMHRSGTSLLGRLLEQCGLFVGAAKDRNNEALLFLRLNEWLFDQCGARWDNPGAISYLWQQAGMVPRRKAETYVRDLLASPRAALFLGWRRFAIYRSIFELEKPWGWKDPRNTFTLPFWRALFPHARVVFIQRHGVDVAESLRVRSWRSVETTWRRYKKGRVITWVRPKRGGFADSPRCLSLEGGFSLWESYQSQARRMLDWLPEDQVFSVRYEDLLAEPGTVLRGACSFCGLSVNETRLREVIASVKPERAASYRRNAELAQFAREQRHRLQIWGYLP